MNRTPVVSSNVKALAYDSDAEILEVEFRPGRDGVCAVWQYHPVAAIVWETMMEPGESIGRWISILRNDSLVEATRIDPEEAAS